MTANMERYLFARSWKHMRVLGYCLVALGCSSTTSSNNSSAGGSSGQGAQTSGTCDTVINWSHNDDPACDDCVQSSCAAETRSLDDVASSCQSQYEAAFACNTCACANNAISNKTLCQTPLDKFFACKAAKCESPCK